MTNTRTGSGIPSGCSSYSNIFFLKMLKYLLCIFGIFCILCILHILHIKHILHILHLSILHWIISSWKSQACWTKTIPIKILLLNSWWSGSSQFEESISAHWQPVQGACQHGAPLLSWTHGISSIEGKCPPRTQRTSRHWKNWEKSEIVYPCIDIRTIFWHSPLKM